MSDKVLIQGVGSVMVRDWPHLSSFAPFCVKGCQQLLLLPGGAACCPPPYTEVRGEHGGVSAVPAPLAWGATWGKGPEDCSAAVLSRGPAFSFQLPRKTAQPQSGFWTHDCMEE